MRRWLLLVMVLLLPLRGWLGEAMAGEMLQQEVVGVVQHHAAAAAHDCDHHGGGAAHPHQPHHPHAPHGHDHDEAQAQPGGDCPTCAACQVCPSVALWPPAPAIVATGFHHPPPQDVQPAFTSAEPLLAFKPPRA